MQWLDGFVVAAAGTGGDPRGLDTIPGGLGHHLGASDRPCGVRGPRYLSRVAAIAPINTPGGASMSGPRRLGVWRLLTGCREPGVATGPRAVSGHLVLWSAR